jgi:hypothetical protein
MLAEQACTLARRQLDADSAATPLRKQKYRVDVSGSFASTLEQA